MVKSIIKLTIPDSVLVQETIIKFGYDPSKFVRSDHEKKVVCICKICNEVSVRSFVSVLRRIKKDTKCRSYSNVDKGNNAAKTNSVKMKEGLASGKYKKTMLNKSHSQETKDKISNFFLGKTFVDRFGEDEAAKLKKESSERFVGDGNPFFNKKHSDNTKSLMKADTEKNRNKKKALSELRKGKSLEEQYGEERAHSIKEKLISSTHQKAIFNGYVREKYKGYFFRSSWESKVAKYFDDNNIEWIYESMGFKLKKTTYFPDFYLCDEDKWIEVKGYWYEGRKDKFEQFKQMYPDIKIEVWDKEKLKSLKII